MIRTSRFHRHASFATLPALVAAGILFSATTGVNAQATATPAAMGVVAAPPGLAACGSSELGSLPEGTKAATVYAVVPEESEARYRVQEELAQVGKTEAVGKTQAIIGQIAFGDDGLPMPCSRFDIDMRTLKSNEARRDNFLYKNTLQAETYPLATFVLRDVEGLDAPWLMVRRRR